MPAMTPWLLFGAGGTGVGASLLALGEQQRRPLVVLVRSPAAAERLISRGIVTVVADACDAEGVRQACQRAGTRAVVISTMGGNQDYLAHRTVIDVAQACGITRMVLVTSLGCGDSWPTLSARAKAAFGPAVREKSLAESWLQTSSLDYAIIRPGGLLDGASSGKARLYQNQEVHGFVNRSDVALAIQGLLEQPALNNQVYSLVEPGLKPGA